MKKKLKLWLVPFWVVLVCLPGMALANLWQFEATPAWWATEISGFSILFDDDDNNNTVALIDIVDFSGFHENINGRTYDEIYGIPSLSIGGLTLVQSNTLWSFTQSSGSYSFQIPNSYFTFTAEVVPIPGAVWLFGSGLIGMVGLRRRRLKK